MTTDRPFLLRERDRIVFLGDSITEQQLYTNQVETYLAARYPELALTFFNAGWGGDTAPGGAQRLERDVLSLKPTVVTICYGMNDGRYVEPTDEIRETYVKGMRELVARLGAAGVRVVLLTPGMVDESVNPALVTVAYNRRGLRVLADEVLKLAASEKLPVCDLQALMLEVNARAKAADPKFCMVPDSVHPDPAGHLVMTFGLLQALGVPPRRQEIDVDIPARRATASDGLAIRRLRVNAHGAGFDLLLNRLPFFVEPLARKVLPFLPFQETFNQLTLRLHGLQSARVSFRNAIARGPSLAREALEQGINLFDQYAIEAQQRAEQVHRYTQEKDQVYFKIWRNLALNGVNGPGHNARVLAAGAKASPLLDRGRDTLLKGRGALTCRVRACGTDLPGEPVEDGDFIGQWCLRGPFPKPFESDPLGGETAFTARLPQPDSAWQRVELDLVNPGNNLCAVFGARTDCFAYALTVIESPIEQAAELRIGSDDGVAVWLNGASVWQNLQVARGLSLDQDRVPVQLRKGSNVLLLKIAQGMAAWGMCTRLSGLRKPVSARVP